MTRLSTTVFAAVLAAAAMTVSAQADEIEGTVQAVDTDMMTLTLDDGTVIEVVENVSLEGIAPGAKVKIITDVANAATSIEVMQ